MVTRGFSLSRFAKPQPLAPGPVRDIPELAIKITLSRMRKMMILESFGRLLGRKAATAPKMMRSIAVAAVTHLNLGLRNRQ